MKQRNTKRMVYLGLMVGLALALHLFETYIPIPMPVPGAKLGLANIITMFVIVRFGGRDAILVTIIRTCLGSLFAGTLFTPTFFLSFFGGLASAIVMSLIHKLFKKHFSIVGISIVGAITHNLTQLTIAAFIVHQVGVYAMLPYMLLFALPTGFFVGLVTQVMLKYQNKF